MALVIALAMVLGMMGMTVLADEESGTPAQSTPASKTITIKGLAEGDVVKYYKVIKWTDSGWEFEEPFATALTADEKKEITGYAENGSVVLGKITDNTATKMGGASAQATAIVTGGNTVDDSAEWSKSDQDPGLYMALITSGTQMAVYNPVFVAVQADNAGGEVVIPLSYADSGTAKKSDITVDKKAKDHDDQTAEWAEATTQDVGDIIDFKVDVTVPAYLENWTDPVFTVTDTITSGLTLAVKDGEGDAALTDITVKAGDVALLNETDYTVLKSATGYTITFTGAYLKGRTAATSVTIEYQAKITAEAKNVNPETNTVKIEYSRNPGDASDHGTKEDKTTHYTFSIDAGLFGNETYETSELVKVGVDAAGNPVNEEKTYSNTTKHHPLEGAEFKLYTDEDCTTPYINSKITANTVFTSSDTGKLNITGLDEGTYYLKETKAATGFMLLTNAVKFEIEAEYKPVAATETCNAYEELDYYTVKVNGTEVTSTYKMDNGTIKIENEVAGDNTYEIKNTQGTSLPSTGGIGTTIFYVVGAILVIGAGVVLVTKRRMNQ